jgi:hypothetical protein
VAAELADERVVARSEVEGQLAGEPRDDALDLVDRLVALEDLELVLERSRVRDDDGRARIRRWS